MANGKLGSLNITTLNAPQTLYTVPSTKYASVNIAAVNRSLTTAIKVRVAIGAATPNPQDFLEYDTLIPIGGVLERTAIVCGANEVVTVQVDNLGLSVRAHGFEYP